VAKYAPAAWRGKQLFVGIDQHRASWHVTIRSEDGLVLFRNVIDGHWAALQPVLERYRGAGGVRAVYEAGYFGFGLYDQLQAAGIEAMVTPPHLIPRALGNKVKTDRLDSYRLAELLQAGLLRPVYVPTPQERAHREVARRRRQYLGNRVRTQNRLKAQLRLSGKEAVYERRGGWSARFVRELESLPWDDPYQRRCFQVLLAEYHFQEAQIRDLTQQLHELAADERYRGRVALLRTVPRMGRLTAIELLLELQDVGRFRRAAQLGAYVGLTPAQYSSGEHVRLGRITGQGKPMLRMLLVQLAWRVIGADGALRQRYEALRGRAGGKRAIVAIARLLLLRIRHMLLADEPYVVGLVSG
jgi:transposase